MVMGYFPLSFPHLAGIPDWLSVIVVSSVSVVFAMFFWERSRMRPVNIFLPILTQIGVASTLLPAMVLYVPGIFGVVLVVFLINNLGVTPKQLSRSQKAWTGCIFFVVNLLLLYGVGYAGYWMIL